MQIRTVSREDVAGWASTSRARSKDIGEVLDRAGVLLTPERLATIRAIVMNQIAQGLEDTPTSQIVGDAKTLTDFQTKLASTLRLMANSEIERIKKP